MIIKLVIGLCCLILCPVNLSGQNHFAPSLTASTDQIAYTKGTLDAELIATIIASKQEEVKKELMHRTILNCLECGPFATWNYTRLTLNALLDEKDARVITKEMLKNTTELAVVLGFSEYYLRLLANRSYNEQLTNREMKFLLQYFKWMDLDSRNAVYGEFISEDRVETFTSTELAEMKWDSLENTGSYYKVLAYYSKLNSKNISVFINDPPKNEFINDPTEKDSLKNAKKYKNMAEKTDVSKYFRERTGSGVGNVSKGLTEISYLKKFNNETARYSESAGKYNAGFKNNCDFISPNHILIDMVYDICKSNSYLQSYGFFNSSTINDSTYKYLNKYTIFHNKIGADYETLVKDIEALVNLLMGSFDIIKNILDEEDQIKLNVNLINQAIADTDTANAKQLKDVIGQIQNLKIRVPEGIDEDWSGILDNLVKLSSYDQTKDQDSKLLYYLEKIIEPNLLKLKIATDSDTTSLENLRSVIGSYKQRIKLTALDSLKNSMTRYNAAFNLADTSSVDFSDFIILINTINDLDEVVTYEIIAKFLTSSGELFGDSRAVKVFNRLVNDFDKYLLIDTKNKTLDANVEDMAVDIYKTFGEDISGKFSIYFGVGSNQGLPLYQDFISQEAEVNSLYFVSEKIGIQFKLIDWDRNSAFGKRNKQSEDKRKVKQYTRNPGGRDPFVNNWHLLLYGSGFLYQVDFLNSEDQVFNDPLFGLGTGITFFNGLDLNLSIATLSNFNDPFFNLGFDIKITEYLSQLRKR